MKQYFITIQYTQSNLSTMEKDLLGEVRKFNSCIISEFQIDNLMSYLRVKQEELHKVKPRLKTSDISKYGNRKGLTFINIGQITMRLHEIAYLPKAFVEYDCLLAL